MSPIHDQGYRRYTGPRRQPGRAWLVILRAGARALAGRKGFLGLLLLAWVPFLVRTVQIYVVATYPEAGRILAVDVELFQRFIGFQSVFAFFVTIYAGAGLIANDRRTRALQLYLSRPLRRMEYVGGKLGILMVYLALVTMVPSLLLVLMQVILSGSFAFVRAHPFLVPAVLAASLLHMALPAVAMVALSSLSTSARYAAAMYAGLVFFSQAAAGVLGSVTGSPRAVWLSFPGNLDIVSSALFGEVPRAGTPVFVSLVVLAALTAGAIAIVHRQVRAVEIVT